MDYLPTYGNSKWKTPNIDELAKKGTVFTKHYTAAPSTVMSFYSMITGKYAHETNYEVYEKIHDVYQGETLFTRLRQLGYKSHIAWDEKWMILPEYFDCYRDDVEIHILDNIRQGVGAHYIHDGFLEEDVDKKKETYNIVYRFVNEVLDTEEDTFLWIHFPHVLNGCISYGSDIELFDECIGAIRKLVSDECIAVTADHGNMNGHKGKIGYGFHVYQPAVQIPFITPKIDGRDTCDINTSSVDLYTILFEKKIDERDFIYSDSAYCAQQHRKLAILHDKYKYIYNKENGTEELYDLEVDPTEEFSLIEDYIYDTERKVNAPSREMYYYADWDLLPQIRDRFRAEKSRIWKDGSIKGRVDRKIKKIIPAVYTKIRKK